MTIPPPRLSAPELRRKLLGLGFVEDRQKGCHLILSGADRNYGDVCRSPGPPLGRLAPRRCRLALTPGRPPENGGLRAGDGLARGRGVSGRPG